MSTITVENILRQIDQLPPVEQSRLARLLEERRAERASQPAKAPRDKRLPDRPAVDDSRERAWIEEHRYGDKTIRTDAKVDPGSAVCLFSHEDGLDLGVPIEQGYPIKLGGLTGSLEAFGHEVTLQTGHLVFQSTVYFAKYPGLPRNLLGRRGWLRNLRLGLIDYDNLL
jgi:hypothetical protein